LDSPDFRVPIVRKPCIHAADRYLIIHEPSGAAGSKPGRKVDRILEIYEAEAALRRAGI